jgi:hypothetical protein
MINKKYMKKIFESFKEQLYEPINILNNKLDIFMNKFDWVEIKNNIKEKDLSRFEYYILNIKYIHQLYHNNKPFDVYIVESSPNRFYVYIKQHAPYYGTFDLPVVEKTFELSSKEILRELRIYFSLHLKSFYIEDKKFINIYDAFNDLVYSLNKSDYQQLIDDGVINNRTFEHEMESLSKYLTKINILPEYSRIYTKSHFVKNNYVIE